MASNKEDLRGYDHQFVEKYSDGLLCLICLCVARDPQQLSCCGKLLCKGCLQEHKKIPTTALNVENISAVLLIKKVMLSFIVLKRNHDNII